MTELEKFQWWHPEAGFFGPHFYLKGDHSIYGPDPEFALTLNERTQKEVNFIIKYLEANPGDKILDCPCGYGRHLLDLALKGYQLTGIDMNYDFLKIGEKKAIELGLNGQAKFIEQNMQNLQLVPASFDHIVNMFTSFGFFEKDEENRNVLSNFFHALKPQGKLLLHFDFNATRIINQKYFKGDENVYRKCTHNNRNYDLSVDESYDKRSKRLSGSWTLRGDMAPVTKFYSIRIYSNKEISDLLSDIGFRTVEFYDPSHTTFNNESKETIIVATK